ILLRQSGCHPISRFQDSRVCSCPQFQGIRCSASSRTWCLSARRSTDLLHQRPPSLDACLVLASYGHAMPECKCLAYVACLSCCDQEDDSSFHPSSCCVRLMASSISARRSGFDRSRPLSTL